MNDISNIVCKQNYKFRPWEKSRFTTRKNKSQENFIAIWWYALSFTCLEYRAHGIMKTEVLAASNCYHVRRDR